MLKKICFILSVCGGLVSLNAQESMEVKSLKDLGKILKEKIKENFGDNQSLDHSRDLAGCPCGNRERKKVNKERDEEATLAANFLTEQEVIDDVENVLKEVKDKVESLIG